MMYMSSNDAFNLANQHQQDLLREAEADRLLQEAKRGSVSGAPSLLATLDAALAAIARLGQQGANAEVKAAATIQPSIGPSMSHP